MTIQARDLLKVPKVDWRWAVERELPVDPKFKGQPYTENGTMRVIIGPFHDREQAVTWAVENTLGSKWAFKIHPIYPAP